MGHLAVEGAQLCTKLALWLDVQTFPWAYAKLGVVGRAPAALFAMERGLLGPVGSTSPPA